MTEAVKCRLDCSDDRMVLPYARGMTVREIQASCGSYGVEVSADVISRVTDAVL